MEEDLGYLDASYMILKGKDRMPRSYFCCPVNVLHPVLVTTRQDDLLIETERLQFGVSPHHAAIRLAHERATRQ